MNYFKRVIFTLNVNASKDGLQAISKHKAELVDSAHRIGRDLPMAYVNAHQLDKE